MEKNSACDGTTRAAAECGVLGIDSLDRSKDIHALTNTSQIAMIISPTVTALGSELDAQIIAGGAGKKSGGGVAGSLEYVLKPLTTYLFRLTNVNGTSHAAHLALEWYE